MKKKIIFKEPIVLDDLDKESLELDLKIIYKALEKFTKYRQIDEEKKIKEITDESV